MHNFVDPVRIVFKKGLTETTHEKGPFARLEVAGSPPNLPPCPNCGSVVQRMLSIPSACMAWITEGAYTLDVDLISCWQCRCAAGQVYRGNLERGIEFISWVAGRESYPLWDDYPSAFPPFSVDLYEQTQSERDLNGFALTFPGDLAIREETLRRGFSLEIYNTPGYYVGGVPMLLQPAELNICPICERDLQLLATVPNHNGSPTGFFDWVDVVMVFYTCLNCGVISSTHQTD